MDGPWLGDSGLGLRWNDGWDDSGAGWLFLDGWRFNWLPWVTGLSGWYGGLLLSCVMGVVVGCCCSWIGRRGSVFCRDQFVIGQVLLAWILVWSGWGWNGVVSGLTDGAYICRLGKWRSSYGLAGALA